MVRLTVTVSLVVGVVALLYGKEKCDSVALRIRTYDQTTLKGVPARVEIIHLRTHDVWKILRLSEGGTGKTAVEKRDYAILVFATNYLPLVDYLLLEDIPVCEAEREFYLVPVDYYLYWKGRHLLAKPSSQDTILWIDRNGEKVAEIPIVFSAEDNLILPVSINALRRIARHMTDQDTALVVELRGYVPLNVEDTSYEQKIARRIATVKQLLVDFGVDSTRLWEQVAYESQQATTPEQQLWRWLHQVEIIKVPAPLEQQATPEVNAPPTSSHTLNHPEAKTAPSSTGGKPSNCTEYLISSSDTIDSLTFYVQVGVFMKGYKPLSIRKLHKNKELAGMVVREPLGNMERYLLGPVAFLKDAIELRHRVVEEGITDDAFVVPYWNNKRSDWTSICRKLQTQ